DGEAALQQFVGFVRQDVAYALRARPFGVVVVDAANDFADLLLLAQRVVGGAQRVVEHHDAPGAALALNQLDHLGVVDALDLVGVEEVLHLRVVTHEAEAVALELKFAGVVAAVVNGDAARIGRAAGAHVGATRVRGDGENLAAVVDDV